ncbi:MAG: SusD/RagB family nutrient-binding outer membrane lipoprotein [Bacteroidetes bacterium]|nr:MAG: SusD/RagB family nutrient-binding outer membrane lipoprotein [Bacteroidota bacterium]
MKKLIILLTVLLALGTSCKKDFLSVNEFNPNSASAVPSNLVLTAALNTTSRLVTSPRNYTFIYMWYGCMSVSGGYSQPSNLIQYNLLNSDYQGDWNSSYLNLQNYDYIEKNSATAKLQSYKAIAKIMKVYLFQYLVDTYGNVPYSQALKGSENPQVLKPAYDNQQTIYEDLVVQLDAAMDLINTTPPDADEVGAYDIIYNGDMAMWLKFANTLKLRILINQSDMTGRASYISSAIATTSSNGYIGTGESAMLNPGYLQSSGKMNPFWETFYKQDGSQQSDGLGYFVAGQDACDFLTANNDPRKLRFFQAISGTTIRGNYFGALVLEPVPTTSRLGPGMLRAYNQSAPILTDFESLFLQAEAVQRGIITGDAKALYESAVTRSVIYMGGTSGAAATYLAQVLNNVGFDASTNKLRAIITQKWCALNGVSPMPIWTDYRRTGFPDFIHWTAQANRLNDTPPVRLLYPQTEISTNNENVLAQGDINPFTSKIFWQNR